MATTCSTPASSVPPGNGQWNPLEPMTSIRAATTMAINATSPTVSIQPLNLWTDLRNTANQDAPVISILHLQFGVRYRSQAGNNPLPLQLANLVCPLLYTFLCQDFPYPVKHGFYIILSLLPVPVLRTALEKGKDIVNLLPRKSPFGGG